jgi:hypothetical protein
MTDLVAMASSEKMCALRATLLELDGAARKLPFRRAH